MRQILIIARNAAAQGIRMKLSVVLLVFLVLLTPGLPFILKSDGTLTGQLRLMLTYNLEIITMLLSVSTVFMAIVVVSSEIKGRQITVLDTKPVSRWRILVGKWLGVMLIHIVFLAMMGSAVYGLAYYMIRDASEGERDKVVQEVLVARKAIQPQPADLEAMVRKTIEAYRAETGDRDPERLKQARAVLKYNLKRSQWAVPPRMVNAWNFEGLPQPRSETDRLTVRYKVNSSERNRLPHCPIMWFFGSAGKASFRVLTRETSGAFHEFQIPAKGLIGVDGSLTLGIQNLDDRSGTLVFPKDGLRVLYPVGGFAANYASCMLSILIWLGFLAAVGIASATFLSFPVASLACLFILFISLGSGIMKDVFSRMEKTVTQTAEQRIGVDPQQAGAISSVVSRAILTVLPDYTLCDTIPSLARGLAVEGKELINTLVFLLLLRGGIVMLFGTWIFYRREFGGTV